MKRPQSNIFSLDSLGDLLKFVISQKGSSLRRWIHVICLNLHVFMFLYIGFIGFDKWSEIYERGVQPLEIHQLAIGSYLVGVLLWMILDRSNAIGQEHSLITYLRSPPVWLGLLLLPALCVYTYQAYFETDNLLVQKSWIFCFFVFIGVYLAGTYDRITSMQVTMVVDEAPVQVLDISSDDGFLRWINDDSPISSIHLDQFDRAPMVERVSRRLRRKSGCNLAVLGRFGSGKSSFINLVENATLREFVSPGPRIVFIRIDGWGLSRNSVAETILDKVIAGISMFCDLSSVSNVSMNYRLSLGLDKHPLIDAFRRFLLGRHDAISELYRLNDLIRSANLVVYVVLEDLDRNYDPFVFQEEVPALVEKVRALRNIGFIVAVGSDRIHFDTLVRICDYSEILG